MYGGNTQTTEKRPPFSRTDVQFNSIANSLSTVIRVREAIPGSLVSVRRQSTFTTKGRYNTPEYTSTVEHYVQLPSRSPPHRGWYFKVLSFFVPISCHLSHPAARNMQSRRSMWSQYNCKCTIHVNTGVSPRRSVVAECCVVGGRKFRAICFGFAEPHGSLKSVRVSLNPNLNERIGPISSRSMKSARYLVIMIGDSTSEDEKAP